MLRKEVDQTIIEALVDKFQEAAREKVNAQLYARYFIDIDDEIERDGGVALQKKIDLPIEALQTGHTTYPFLQKLILPASIPAITSPTYIFNYGENIELSFEQLLDQQTEYRYLVVNKGLCETIVQCYVIINLIRHFHQEDANKVIQAVFSDMPTVLAQNSSYLPDDYYLVKQILIDPDPETHNLLSISLIDHDKSELNGVFQDDLFYCDDRQVINPISIFLLEKRQGASCQVNFNYRMISLLFKYKSFFVLLTKAVFQIALCAGSMHHKSYLHIGNDGNREDILIVCQTMTGINILQKKFEQDKKQWKALLLSVDNKEDRIAYNAYVLHVSCLRYALHIYNETKESEKLLRQNIAKQVLQVAINFLDLEECLLEECLLEEYSWADEILFCLRLFDEFDCVVENGQVDCAIANNVQRLFENTEISPSANFRRDAGLSFYRAAKILHRSQGVATTAINLLKVAIPRLQKSLEFYQKQVHYGEYHSHTQKIQLSLQSAEEFLKEFKLDDAQVAASASEETSSAGSVRSEQMSPIDSARSEETSSTASARLSEETPRTDSARLIEKTASIDSVRSREEVTPRNATPLNIVNFVDNHTANEDKIKTILVRAMNDAREKVDKQFHNGCFITLSELIAQWEDSDIDIESMTKDIPRLKKQILTNSEYFTMLNITQRADGGIAFYYKFKNIELKPFDAIQDLLTNPNFVMVVDNYGLIKESIIHYAGLASLSDDHMLFDNIFAKIMPMVLGLHEEIKLPYAARLSKSFANNNQKMDYEEIIKEPASLGPILMDVCYYQVTYDDGEKSIIAILNPIECFFSEKHDVSNDWGRFDLFKLCCVLLDHDLIIDEMLYGLQAYSIISNYVSADKANLLNIFTQIFIKSNAIANDCLSHEFKIDARNAVLNKTEVQYVVAHHSALKAATLLYLHHRLLNENKAEIHDANIQLMVQSLKLTKSLFRYIDRDKTVQKRIIRMLNAFVKFEDRFQVGEFYFTLEPKIEGQKLDPEIKKKRDIKKQYNIEKLNLGHLFRVLLEWALKKKLLLLVEKLLFHAEYYTVNRMKWADSNHQPKIILEVIQEDLDKIKLAKTKLEACKASDDSEALDYGLYVIESESTHQVLKKNLAEFVSQAEEKIKQQVNCGAFIEYNQPENIKVKNVQKNNKKIKNAKKSNKNVKNSKKNNKTKKNKEIENRKIQLHNDIKEKLTSFKYNYFSPIIFCPNNSGLLRALTYALDFKKKASEALLDCLSNSELRMYVNDDICLSLKLYFAVMEILKFYYGKQHGQNYFDHIFSEIESRVVLGPILMSGSSEVGTQFVDVLDGCTLKVVEDSQEYLIFCNDKKILLNAISFFLGSLPQNTLSSDEIASCFNLSKMIFTLRHRFITRKIVNISIASIKTEYTGFIDFYERRHHHAALTFACCRLYQAMLPESDDLGCALEKIAIIILKLVEDSLPGFMTYIIEPIRLLQSYLYIQCELEMQSAQLKSSPVKSPINFDFTKEQDKPFKRKAGPLFTAAADIIASRGDGKMLDHLILYRAYAYLYNKINYEWAEQEQLAKQEQRSEQKQCAEQDPIQNTVVVQLKKEKDNSYIILMNSIKHIEDKLTLEEREQFVQKLLCCPVTPSFLKFFLQSKFQPLMKTDFFDRNLNATYARSAIQNNHRLVDDEHFSPLTRPYTENIEGLDLHSVRSNQQAQTQSAAKLANCRYRFWREPDKAISAEKESEEVAEVAQLSAHHHPKK